MNIMLLVDVFMLLVVGFLFGVWYARCTVHPYCQQREDGTFATETQMPVAH